MCQCVNPPQLRCHHEALTAFKAAETARNLQLHDPESTPSDIAIADARWADAAAHLATTDAGRDSLNGRIEDAHRNADLAADPEQFMHHMEYAEFCERAIHRGWTLQRIVDATVHWDMAPAS